MIGFQLKLALARAAGALSRGSGRGGGTTLPGRLLLRLAPDAIERLGAGLSDGVTIVSATNGKTTTATMIAAVLAAEGREPVHNRAGSNMHWGVATALLAQRGKEGLFEVDEAWLPQLAAQLHPGLIVLGNLFRDQLDRYGELEQLADRWEETVRAVSAETAFALNADDPLVADLGRGVREPTWFGLEDTSHALAEPEHAHDAKHCRRCGAPYEYRVSFLGHLGHYACPSCGAARPEPDVAATSVRLDGMSGSRIEVRTPAGPLTVDLPLPGLYNVYNALAAIAASLRLGVSLDGVRRGLESMRAAFGRVERVELDGSSLSILLIKNPVGANEVLRTLRLEAGDGELDLWLALNDGIADGRDVSWIWDADFEPLAGSVRRATCTGTRAAEMALRLKYAGWPDDRVEVVEGVGPALDAAVEASDGLLFALPTYTALLELRTLLTRRGLVEEYWS